ncbi:MAG: M48 family metalloprotease [Candidatus Aenigmarchaeota archaeon]|nr:M48 family metalloprotease [Candidatus Aenigmarchaeota archaeon]
MKQTKWLVFLSIFLLLFPFVSANSEKDLDFKSYKGNSTGLLYDYLGKENIQEHKQKKFMDFLIYGSAFLIFIVFLIFLMKSGISRRLGKLYSSKIKSQFLIVGLYLLTFLLFFYLFGLLPNIYKSFILGTRDRIEFLIYFISWSKFVIFNGGGLIIIIEILYVIIRKFRNKWWLVASIIIIFLSIFYFLYFSSICEFFFGKSQKIWILEEGYLRNELMKLVNKAGVELDEIYVRNDTKSDSASAWASSFSEKEITVNTNLIVNCTTNEIKAIFAHELGHIKYDHPRRGIYFAFVLLIIASFFVHLIYKKLLKKYKIKRIYDISGFPLFILSFLVVLIITLIIVINVMRFGETQADRYGLELNRDPYSWISLNLERSKDSLNRTSIFSTFETDPIPNPIIEFLTFTHPPTYKRIDMTMEYYN